VDLFQWVALAGGACVFFFALLVLLVVVVVKVRAAGRRSSASIAQPAGSLLGETLRQRMEREDREQAEKVIDALYTTGRYLDNQADRDARMKNAAGSLKTMFGAAPAPNA
jgi:hypothetical protein